MNDVGSRAEERVWQALPAGAKEVLDGGMPGADLQTLLLSVLRHRAAPTQPADVVRQWRTDRFVKPSAADPRDLARAVARLWDLLPEAFEGVELSPVAPLGTCSSVAPVSPNRIVPTARLTEVVSDSTNALAIEAAVRRRRQGGPGEVHLAAHQRQLRAQTLAHGHHAHFALFALVSSMRDSGSAHTEAHLLTEHLRFWRTALGEFIPDAEPRLELTVFDHTALAERVADTVLPGLNGLNGSGPVRIVAIPEQARGRGYYRGAALRLTAHGGEVELGDGGFTTWTAQLKGDAKERCLVSCVATERLLELAPRGAA